MLQLKTDLLGSIFGQERAATLLEQVTSSVRDRDLLHNSLLQRKSKLQVSISSFALEPGHWVGVDPVALDVRLCARVWAHKEVKCNRRCRYKHLNTC